ncbi:MAG: PAS domain S-box protein, partial [Xanthobacteraceae bacterium]|nr:PAS domain S-box protein [Xanthobacteraceae bacterium]
MKRYVPDLASLRSPLARRLIVAIILVSSTITLCLTAFQLYGEYRSELEIIEGDFRQIDAVHLKSLSQSLWTTDEAELRLQIEGVVHLPNLEYVVVREGDRILAQAGRRVSSKIIERQYPLTNVHRGQTLEIGTLTVVAGLDTVYRELAKRVFIILASNAFKTFLVAGFAFAFFHWLVNRHLLAIAGYLRGLDLRGRASPLILARAAGRRPDELDEVAAQLNRMLDAQMEAFRQLRENEEAQARLAAIVESSNDAIIGRGRDRTIISWNAAAERILGYTAAEAIGRDLAANYPPDMRQEAMEIRRLVGTGVSVPYFETVRITKDGRRIDVGLSVSPIRDSNGNTIGTAAIIRDITERKRAEQAAAAQSRLTEAVFSYSVSCLAILDRDFNFIRVNDAYARVCRKDIAEFAGRNHFDMYPSDAKLIFDEVVRDKRPFETFARPFVFPDQPEREVTYWDWTLVPVLDQRGEVQYLVFSLNEVTERKQAEVALREREHLMRLVTENVPAMIAYFDAELICRFANAAYCEFHRLDPQGVIGKTLREIAGDNTYRVIRPSIYLVKAGKPTLLHREEHTATGGIRHIEIHRVPDMSPEGVLRGYYAMLLDITEHRQAERATRAAHAKLREFTAHMQSALESERARIARDVHDSLGGALTGISMDLSWCIKQLKPARVKRDTLDRLRVMVGQA